MPDVDTDLDDAVLVQAWRDGDRSAANALVKRYVPVVYRFLANKLDGDVDDLVQRTFLDCQRGLEGLRNAASFRPFVLRLAQNNLFMHYRKNAVRDRLRPVATLSVAELSGAAPSRVLAKREQDQRLLAALRRLPLELQTVTELYYWDNVPVGEIAEITEVPVGTVKSRLSRARARLKELIEEESDEMLELSLSSLRPARDE